MTDYNIAVETEDLTVAYDTKPVLWDVDISIPQGQLSAIIGPNGAGKTTLLKAMLGLIKPVSGTVRFFPGEVPAPDRRQILRRIAYVPQSGSVDWDFPATALDVALMGRYGTLGWVRRPRAADRALAMQMLARVGMQDYADRQISRLSGGQQQRVFLARALAQQADLYLMDEPFKGVDAKTEVAIIALLRELREQGKTVVVVHHDLSTVSDYFDWIVLVNLHLIACGPTAGTFTDENITHTYKGGIIPRLKGGQII